MYHQRIIELGNGNYRYEFYSIDKPTLAWILGSYFVRAYEIAVS